ncbi:unnamed protein product [Protopolystoma xenopodis]|uniref:Uncharacterized protein n=1 Tax=Protopolystoma xenopodis TaxID=117903 RepID=A0A3S5AE79_9PLAT|nr:unnamed protein product [Protopolystoma xenopodis]
MGRSVSPLVSQAISMSNDSSSISSVINSTTATYATPGVVDRSRAWPRRSVYSDGDRTAGREQLKPLLMMAAQPGEGQKQTSVSRILEEDSDPNIEPNYSHLSIGVRPPDRPGRKHNTDTLAESRIDTTYWSEGRPSQIRSPKQPDSRYPGARSLMDESGTPGGDYHPSISTEDDEKECYFRNGYSEDHEHREDGDEEANESSDTSKEDNTSATSGHTSFDGKETDIDKARHASNRRNSGILDKNLRNVTVDSDDGENMTPLPTSGAPLAWASMRWSRVNWRDRRSDANSNAPCTAPHSTLSQLEDQKRGSRHRRPATANFTDANLNISQDGVFDTRMLTSNSSQLSRLDEASRPTSGNHAPPIPQRLRASQHTKEELRSSPGEVSSSFSQVCF